MLAPMSETDPRPDGEPALALALRAARSRLLTPPRQRPPVWPLLAAAALAAGAGLGLAAAVIMGPPHLGPDLTLDRHGAPVDTSP
jgi:hypothetical protein